MCTSRTPITAKPYAPAARHLHRKPCASNMAHRDLIQRAVRPWNVSYYHMTQEYIIGDHVLPPLPLEETGCETNILC